MIKEISTRPPIQLQPFLCGLIDKPVDDGAFQISINMEKFKIIQDLGMSYPNEKSHRLRHYFLAECPFCKTLFKLSKDSLRFGTTKSCGCYKRKRSHERFTTHGLSKTRIYKEWTGLIQRCHNPKNKRYYDYGGRGVVVCDEWRNDFQVFYDWAMSNGYADNLTINRINDSKFYSPSTCEYTDKYKQGQDRRKRKDNTSGFTGVRVEKSTNKWVAQINNRGIKFYLGVFDTKEQAAQAYNDFVIKNKTFHHLNKI